MIHYSCTALAMVQELIEGKYVEHIENILLQIRIGQSYRRAWNIIKSVKFNAKFPWLTADEESFMREIMF